MCLRNSHEREHSKDSEVCKTFWTKNKRGRGMGYLQVAGEQNIQGREVLARQLRSSAALWGVSSQQASA